MAVNQFIAKAILLPCSKIYGAAVWLRNKLFDWHILRQHVFPVPVVVVGNLAAGGTGKTPHVQYLVQTLCNSYHVAVLSRGYKRHTKGFVLAQPKSTPRDIGDEPYQIYHHFKCRVTVAVCEDRVAGINELLRIDPQINLVILDDAFQHRYVKPTVAIVVTEYNRPLTDDHLLPYGRLREPVHAINRAEIVIMTKCPDTMQPLDFRLTAKSLDLIPSQYLFYSRYVYQNLVPVFPEHTRIIPYLDRMTPDDTILAIAGIGNPRPFVRHLKSFRAKVKVNVFSDHHNFTRRDIDLIKRRFDSIRTPNRLIITTEKDAVRLANNPYYPHALKAFTYYLPIDVQILNRSDLTLDAAVRKVIADHQLFNRR